MAFTTPVNRVVAWGAVAATSTSASTAITAGTTLVFFACASKAATPTPKAVITNSGTALTYVECGEVYLNDNVNPELRCTAYKAQVTANQTVTFTVTSTGSANVAAHATEFVTAELNFGATWATATNTQVTTTTDVSYAFGTAPGANDAVLACAWENGTNTIAIPTGFTNLVGSTTGITVSTNKRMHVAYDIVAPPASSTAWTTSNARQVLLALAIPPLSPPSSIADAWNTNDRVAFALSASDKTATLDSSVNAGVRSTTAIMNGTAGKYYAEIQLTTKAGGPSVGLRANSAVITSTTGATYVSSSGSIFVNGSLVSGSLGTSVTGDVICIAWDTGAEQIWFRYNSAAWNGDGTADPATGVNGRDASGLASENFSLWVFSASTTAAFTVRTELAEYTQAVPSGFTSWMGETPGGGGTNVNVNATGVAAGTALGTVTVSAVAPVSFEAVGVAATTALGSATATGKTNISTEALGAAAVTVLGNASVNTVWNAAATSVGMTAGTALGTATATGIANVSTTPIGQVAATALGNVSVAAGGAVSVIPAGVTATAVTGTVTVTAKISVNVTPTGVSAAAVTASGATAPSASILTSYTPGTDRNDFTGEVGVRLGIGTSDIPITWIGARRCHANQTGLHTVKLYEWFSGLVERTATVDYTGVAVGDYAWASITPHTLGANGYYALLMVVTAFDGQTWSNPGPVTYASSIVNVYDSYYAGGLQTGGQNSSFIGLDLGSGASGAGGVVVTIASTAQAAGAAAATALGTATVTANRSAAVTPTGVAAGTALGGVSIAVGGGISITPSSLAVTALSGTATVAAQQQVSTLAAGASATALSGTAGVSVRSSTVAAGVTASAVVGTATVTAKQAVSTAAVGVTASTALGGVSVAAGGSISVAAAGQSAAALAGTATVTAKQFVSTAATGVTAASVLGIATATGTIVVAANTVGVWTGTAWVQKPAKVWSGSVWMTKPVKTWNGGAWV